MAHLLARVIAARQRAAAFAAAAVQVRGQGARHVALARAARPVALFLAAEARLQLSCWARPAGARVAHALARVHLAGQRLAAGLATGGPVGLHVRALEAILPLGAVAGAQRALQQTRRTRARVAHEVARVRAVGALARSLAHLAARVDHQIRVRIGPHRLAAVAHVARRLRDHVLAVRTAPRSLEKGEKSKTFFDALSTLPAAARCSCWPTWSRRPGAAPRSSASTPTPAPSCQSARCK